VRLLGILLLAALAVVLSSLSLLAQTYSFGKNKVRYEEFEWMVLEGEHFDIYYYPEEERIARLARTEAEESYRFLRAKMDHEITRRVPLIVYSSHEHFEQTNVVPVMIPEGVLGFTEYMKGRVALPFGGSVSEFSRVIRHELVHVFQHDIIERQFDLYRNVRIGEPPLWFTEGLAEYFSTAPEPRGELFLADMVTHGRLTRLGDLWKFGGSYPVYKGGESFVRFLAERYGEGSLVRLLKSLWKGKSFSEAVRHIYARRLTELSDDWIKELKERYPGPKLSAPLSSVRLSREDEVATLPASYRDREGNEKVLFFSSRLSTVKVTEVDAEDGRGRRTLLTAGKEPAYESFHPFESRMDIAGDSILVFSTKQGDSDAVALYDLVRGELLAEYRFASLIEIRSPVLSPSGKHIAFAGLSRAGAEDIYIYDLETGRLAPLTSDLYSDRDPDWSPDGERIVFSSDRTPYGREGFMNLFIARVESGEILRLTSGQWNDQMPRWSPDGSRILFVSDRDGGLRVSVVDERGNGSPLPGIPGGVFSADWSPGGDAVFFSSLRDLSFGVWRADYPPQAEGTFALELDTILTAWVPPSGQGGEASARARPYRPDYSMDIATGGIGFSSAYGTSQGGVLMISDTMGDRIVLLQLDNTATQFGDFVKSLNATVAFLNMKHRLAIGLGAFHARGEFVDFRKSDFPFSEQQYGGFLLLSYPFSRFTRVETSLSLFRSRRQDLVETFDRDSFLAANTLSFVKDNTVWLILGPVEGERYSVSVSLTNDLTRAQPENVSFGLDYRRYFRTGLASAYAVRLQARASEGSLPERYFLGGSWSMRGYPRFSLLGTRAVLLNQEWRFLILRRALEGARSRGFWLPPVEGALFFDAGNAWDPEDESPGVLGSFGAGLRISIAGPFIFRFDLSKRTDFESVSARTYLDFFIGYDY
jgi:WD40 repeat protein